MAFEGMDVSAVESIGHQLQQQGTHIESVVAAVDGLINQAESAWKGQDAIQFQGWWVQQHKPALLNAAQAVSGLGQSALNNAQQQIDASSH